MKNEKPFQTINEACDSTGLSRNYLRDGCKKGNIPFIKSGNKYLINVPILFELLNAESERINEKTVQGA